MQSAGRDNIRNNENRYTWTYLILLLGSPRRVSGYALSVRSCVSNRIPLTFKLTRSQRPWSWSRGSNLSQTISIEPQWPSLPCSPWSTWLPPNRASVLCMFHSYEPFLTSIDLSWLMIWAIEKMKEKKRLWAKVKDFESKAFLIISNEAIISQLVFNSETINLESVSCQ